MSMRSLLMILSLVLIAACASAPRKPMAWDAEALLAESGGIFTDLKNHERAIFATVRTERIKGIVSTAGKIGVVAGVPVRPFLFEGNEPTVSVIKAHNRVGFSLGMIDLLGDDMDAYAAIMGHEVAHLALRHQPIAKREAKPMSGGATAADAVLILFGMNPINFIAGPKFETITAFTRLDEVDADDQGIGYAAEAGYDPNGAVRVWQKMLERPARSSPWLTLHGGSSHERLERVRRFAAAPLPAAEWATARPSGSSAARTGSTTPRLLFIARVASGEELLPPGELFVDTRSIGRYPGADGTQQAWLIVNVTSADEVSGRSISALARVRCPDGVAIVQTVRSAGLNGEGRVLGRADHAERFRPVRADSSLTLAARSICG